MADSISPDDVRKELEKQIADLRKEISALGKSIADRGAENGASTAIQSAGPTSRREGRHI